MSSFKLKYCIHTNYHPILRGKDNVKRTALITRKRKGGLRMPDAESMVKAQRILNSEEYLCSWSSWLDVLDYCLRICFTVILVIQNYKRPFQIFLQIMLGAFHSKEKFWLTFLGISNDEWNNSYPEFPEKMTTSRHTPKFSDISYREFKFASHFIFLPEYFLLELPENYTQIKYSD